MSLKSDHWIRVMSDRHNMITPYEGGLIRHHHKADQSLLSYGTSSYGYDLRCGKSFKIFTPGQFTGAIDPKKFNPEFYKEVVVDDHVLIPPHACALGHSVETLTIPANILALCFAKSTYTRCGLIIQAAPLEPEWTGQVTFQITNATPLPVMVYPNEGILQVVFLESDIVCSSTYADRQGKYQGQKGVTPAKS